MPEVNGSQILVAIDPTGGSTFTKMIVCLTSNSISTNITELDASSKCNPTGKWISGSKIDQTVTGEGNLLDPDTGIPTNVGYPELYSLAVQQAQGLLATPPTVKIGRVVNGVFAPTTGEAVYTGPIIITQLEQVAPFDELVTFTFSFRSASPPFTQTITY